MRVFAHYMESAEFAACGNCWTPYLNGEYVRCYERLGLSRVQLLQIAEMGIDAVFGSPELRRDLAEDLRNFTARARALAEDGSSG
jgi:hypothetical protein